jgi:hypothetical protein
VNVPWAQAVSGFTLLFEALALRMAKEMTVAGMAQMMNCGRAALWRILSRHVADTEVLAPGLSLLLYSSRFPLGRIPGFLTQHNV